MLKQLHIFDTETLNIKLQKMYLANILVNSHRLPYTFQEIDFLLKHQNIEFKRFQSDCNVLL